MSIFSFFLPYLQDHGFLLPWQRDVTTSSRYWRHSPLVEFWLIYCWALILKQLLEEGVPEVSPLVHFLSAFIFNRSAYSPVLLPFRYRGHGDASINDIA